MGVGEMGEVEKGEMDYYFHVSKSRSFFKKQKNKKTRVSHCNLAGWLAWHSFSKVLRLKVFTNITS